MVAQFLLGFSFYNLMIVKYERSFSSYTTVLAEEIPLDSGAVSVYSSVLNTHCDGPSSQRMFSSLRISWVLGLFHISISSVQRMSSLIYAFTRSLAGSSRILIFRVLWAYSNTLKSRGNAFSLNASSNEIQPRAQISLHFDTVGFSRTNSGAR